MGTQRRAGVTETGLSAERLFNFSRSAHVICQCVGVLEELASWRFYGGIGAMPQNLDLPPSCHQCNEPADKPVNEQLKSASSQQTTSPQQ